MPGILNARPNPVGRHLFSRSLISLWLQGFPFSWEELWPRALLRMRLVFLSLGDIKKIDGRVCISETAIKEGAKGVD